MSDAGAAPLYVDTGAFYARADADDRHHETAVSVFEDVRRGALPYRPLYTSQAVLAELATLLLYKLGHADAARTLQAIRDAESITVLPVDPSAFDGAADRFVAYDDQEISFVDHESATLAEARDVEHVFAFDDDFRTLGFTVIPGDSAATQ